MFVSSPSHFLFVSDNCPRWDLVEKYGHVSDDDAVADMILMQEFLTLKAETTKSFHTYIHQQNMARHEPLILCKNKS